MLRTYEVKITAFIDAEDDDDAAAKYADNDYYIDSHTIYGFDVNDERYEVNDYQ